MTLNIGRTENIFSKRQTKTNGTAPLSNLNMTVPRTYAPIKKLSTANYQANFLTFTGKAPPTELEKIFGTGVTTAEDIDRALGIKNQADTSWAKNISAIPDDYLQTVPQYEELADNIAISLGPDKAVILGAEEDADRELLAHAFVKRVRDGQYSGLGLTPNKTAVMLMDGKSLSIANTDLVKELNNLYYVNRQYGTKTVIVLDGVEKLVIDLAKQKPFMNLKTFIESRQLGENIKLIGVMERKACEKSFADAGIVQNLTRLDLDGLSVSATKEYLKRNPYTLYTEVTGRYGNDVTISPEAIDAIVDRASTQVEGSFPKKAFNVIDYVISTKLEEQGLTRNGGIVIEVGDVENFFASHEKIAAKIAPRKGTFSLAERVKTRFSDVGACSAAKEELQDIVKFAKDPKTYIKERGLAPKGILFEGPPGTGKTLLAKALAGEADVPFLATSGGSFGNHYQNSGSMAIREAFDTIKKAAADSGKNVGILFIDEIDGVGKARSANETSREDGKTMSTLLTEIDGFNNKDSKVKIIIVGSTNRADTLDGAIKQRFNMSINVPNPESGEEILDVLRVITKDCKFASEEEKLKILTTAVPLLEGKSGREMYNIIQTANKVVFDRKENKVLTYDDIVEGYLRTVAGPVRKVSAERPLSDIIKTVRHEAGHAVAISTLNSLEKVDFVTLDSRGQFLGAVFHSHREQRNPKFRDIVAKIATSYAGGLAEPEYAVEGYSIGVRGDIGNVTDTVNSAIRDWGMGINTPPIKITELNKDLYVREIKKDTELLTTTGQEVAKRINEFHREFLDLYVERFKANAGKGGNNLSGEAFVKMKAEWITSTGREKAYKKLQRELDNLIENARISNKGIFTKLSKRFARMFH